MQVLPLEIHKPDTGWTPIGEMTLLGDPRQGLKARTKVAYDLDYAVEHLARTGYGSIC